MAKTPDVDVDLTGAQRATLSSLVRSKEAIRPPSWLAEEATIDYEAERALAAGDLRVFWGRKGRMIEWSRPWNDVLHWDPPHHRWFVGGKLNATVSCLDRHVYGEHRNKAAILWVGENGEEISYTYNRLYRETNRFANALKSLGVRRGDRVAVYMPLIPEGIVAMLACARIGAIHTVVSVGLGTQALRERIVDSGAKVVVCSDFTYRRGKAVQLKPAVDEAVRDLGQVDHVIVHRRGSRPGDEPVRFKSERDVDFYDIQQPRAIHCEPEIVDSDHPLFILYTSGTTGKPKGIVHATGGYMVGVTYLSGAFYQIGKRDIYWSVFDIGCIAGHSFLVYGPLSVGATILCREGVPDYPSPDVTWELVERFGVNVMFTAPTVLRMWMSHGGDIPQKYDLGRLRLLACAGEPLNPEAHRWAQKHLMSQANGMVVDNWWQTEIAGPVIGTVPSFEARLGKVGKPMPGVRAEVVTRDGSATGPNEGGLLVIRDPLPYMMSTVWNDPDRYEEYWNQIPGAFAAGDLALQDRDGYIAVLGRSDDVINVAGHRIGAADVESSLLRHPSVAESAVVGLPDELKGERIKAYIVLKPGLAAGAGIVPSLKDHVREDLGPIAQPSEVELVEALPKTCSGAIVRRVLKARATGEDPGDLSTLAD